VKTYFEHVDVVAVSDTPAYYGMLVTGKVLVDAETLVRFEVLLGCGEDSMVMRWIFGIATLCCW
jgi:hypothetical protein